MGARNEGLVNILTPRSRAGRLLRLAFLLVAGGALALLLWCGYWLWVINRYDGLPADGDVRPADVGIVLGAKLWEDEPSPALEERLDLALELYRSGAYDHLILSGGLDVEGDSTLTEAEGMRDYLVQQGVPAAAIKLDSASHSTYENLLYSARIMKEEGWARAVIVTHQYHGARSEDIADFLGYEDVQVQVADSKVLNMAYHRTREVLAYTKWLGEKWLVHGGRNPGID
ncbi:SanA/YdcF family protein [Cohnella fermenti]|uniref:YdcF family protein n=1 Tax=Cohnella fermenti TaxID=2565925 RepID=A0A4S4BIZ9_9BACL|nr:YdcF family protein [Cohnella fermenti]THF74602.1 YdcF family protein [Cohnella fermenti]